MKEVQDVEQDKEDIRPMTAPKVRRTIRITKKKSPMGLLPWAVFSLLAGVGALEYYSQQNIEIRQQKAELRSLEIEAEANAVKARLEADEGNRRYRAGCQMVLGSQISEHGRRDVVVPLSEGMTIYSPHTGEVLADGQFVCDHKFMTYEIQEGVTANPKKADDADLVNQRFEDNLGWDPKVKRGAITIED